MLSMKTILAVLLAWPWTAYAQGQGAAAVRDKLESEYQITKITDDKSGIVTPGSLLLLHKDKVLMFAATTAVDPCMNTYRNRKVSQNLACRLAVMKPPIPIPGKDKVPATRYFVSGEKFRVTKITVRDNGKDRGVVLDFYSEPIDDVHYIGQLTIPFGAFTPAPDDALKVVEEVVTVAPSEDAKNGSDATDPAPEASQPPAAPPPAELPPPPIETPPPPPSDPIKISEGQTIDQVVGAMGQPLTIAKVGTKEIYTYRDLKITFVDGKVKDFQ
jgi:hypothetical protein